MINRPFLSLIVLLSVTGSFSITGVLSAQDLPEAREPQIEPVTRVEQFLTGFRKYVESAHPKPGERALVVTGHSTSPLVNEAMTRVLKEKGIQFFMVMIPDFEGMTDCAELQEQLWIGNWWPEWLWNLIEDEKPDILYQLTMMAQNHNWREGIPLYQWFTKRGIRSRALASTVGTPDWYPVGAPETLSYEPWHSFPVELFEAIRSKTREQFPTEGWALAEVTDLNGTNFTVEINYDPRERTYHSSGKVFRNAQGVIVATTSHSCEFPRAEFIFEDNRLTDVKGGGAFGEWMSQKYLTEYQEVEFGYYGTPGNNFFEEFVLGYHPKSVPYLGDYTGTMRVMGMQWKVFRSGVLHVAIGSGGALLNPDKTIQVKKQHTDFELFFPTIVIGGKTIIVHGHLLALDDPEIRRLAAQYGDPDELLTEDWIPVRNPDGTVNWDAQKITRGPR